MAVRRTQRGQALVDYSVIILLVAALVALGIVLLGGQMLAVLHWTAQTLEIT